MTPAIENAERLAREFIVLDAGQDRDSVFIDPYTQKLVELARDICSLLPRVVVEAATSAEDADNARHQRDSLIRVNQDLEDQVRRLRLRVQSLQAMAFKDLGE